MRWIFSYNLGRKTILNLYTIHSAQVLNRCCITHYTTAYYLIINTTNRKLSCDMDFLRSLYLRSTQSKTVVITVNLPEDKSLMRPRQWKEVYDYDTTLSKTGEEEFKLNEIQILTIPGEDHTLSTDLNTSSEHTLSSKDMDSLNEDDLNSFHVEEMSLSGNANSSCSSSCSSLSLDDHEDVENTLQDTSSDRIDVDVGQSHKREDSIIASIPGVSPLLTRFQSPRKLIVHKSSSKTKPQKLREMRRKASESSKFYVHVFHNQLTTLKEHPPQDNFEDDRCSFDEYDGLRLRWNYCLDIMAKRDMDFIQEMNKGNALSNQETQTISDYISRDR